MTPAPQALWAEPLPAPQAPAEPPAIEPPAAEIVAPTEPAPEPAPEPGPLAEPHELTEEERIYQAARLNPPPEAIPPEPPRERWSPFAIQAPVDAASLITHPSAQAIADAQGAAAAFVAHPDHEDLPPWSPIELQKPMTALEFASGQPIEPLDDPPAAAGQEAAEPIVFEAAHPEAVVAEAMQAEPEPWPEPPDDDDDGSPKPVLYALKGLMMRRRRR
jgi:hypothetical protein